jgi:hypothetical protein
VGQPYRGAALVCGLHRLGPGIELAFAEWTRPLDGFCLHVGLYFGCLLDGKTRQFFDNKKAASSMAGGALVAWWQRADEPVSVLNGG